MKKVRNLLLILLPLFLLQPVLGQSKFNIRLDASGPLPVDTPSLGGTFPFRIILTNQGSNFNGIIDLAYTNDSSGLDIGSSTTSGFEYQPINTTIDSAATDTVSLTAHISQPAFKIGPSVVVIWPIATAGSLIALDSLRFRINVLPNPTGMEEPDRDKIRAFVWNHQFIFQKQLEISLKRVRINDLLGKEILNIYNPADSIQLPQMNTGIYIAEITYNNNKRAIFKFYQE